MKRLDTTKPKSALLNGDAAPASRQASATDIVDISNQKSISNQQNTSDQEGHTKTHAMLAALFDKLENIPLNAPPQNQETVYHRFLKSPFSALTSIISNFGGAWTVVVTAAVLLLKLIPALPQVTNSLTSILLPFGVFTAAALAIASAGRWIRRKAQRVKFLAWMMGIYGFATALYLLWLSLGFLHFNTLPAGFLLATCWFGAISVYRKTIPDVKEILALAEKEIQ